MCCRHFSPMLHYLHYSSDFSFIPVIIFQACIRDFHAKHAAAGCTAALSDCTRTHCAGACCTLSVLQMADAPFPTTVCRSDLRAAQTKNTTGHDGLTFKSSGARCLEPDLFSLLWIFVKLEMLLLLMLFSFIVSVGLKQDGHETHFKPNKKVKHADSLHYLAHKNGLLVKGPRAWKVCPNKTTRARALVPPLTCMCCTVQVHVVHISGWSNLLLVAGNLH